MHCRKIWLSGAIDFAGHPLRRKPDIRAPFEFPVAHGVEGLAARRDRLVRCLSDAAFSGHSRFRAYGQRQSEGCGIVAGAEQATIVYILRLNSQVAMTRRCSPHGRARCETLAARWLARR